VNTLDTRELEQVLVNTVRQLGEVAAGALQTKLPKPFQRPTPELLAALGRLADRGEIYRHPAAKTKFLAFDARAEVRTLLAGVLGPKALTEAELKRLVAKKGATLGLGRASGPLTTQTLKALVRDGVAFVHRRPPPPGASTRPPPKTLRYASVPQPSVGLGPYVRHLARELRAIAKRLAPFGATPDEALKELAFELGLAAAPPLGSGPIKPVSSEGKAAPRGPSGVLQETRPNGQITNGRGAPAVANGEGPTPAGPDGEDRRPADGGPGEAATGGHEGQLLRALDEVAAGEPEGALLSVALVRERAGLAKAAFDRAALDLVQAERVVLHYHDYPASLTPEKRAQLVVDEDGTYYIGIARWRKD
jgi:hypothetical protein